MTGRDDQSLIAACRAGDSDAFGELVRRYQDRLYPTLLRLAGRPDDALDLLQDVFLRAYLKLGHFHGESSFYTWLYRLAVNLALSDRRRRRPAPPPAVEPAEAFGHSDPAGPLLQAERERRVHEAIAALAPEHRAVVVMKDLDGLPYEEIATILKVPVGTVRSRLHRARNELKERLRDLSEESPSGGQERP
jgi:RNA polymerase sigma-70 factor (ECF subfamily)